MKTLILLFHPDFSKSHANRALADAACSVEGVEIIDEGALYPDMRIDADREIRSLFTADRLVLQFPIQWYSTPPLLKAWQDLVLTRMFYINPKEEGERIRDLPILIAATAGNDPEAYTKDGVNLFQLEELLKPLRSTASRCALQWQEPFLMYRSNKSSPDSLQAAGREYAARLAGPWRTKLTD
jgi:putative NADPH-quinone reductase